MVTDFYFWYGNNIKIQLLSDLNLKKTPQLVELAEDNQVKAKALY